MDGRWFVFAVAVFMTLVFSTSTLVLIEFGSRWWAAGFFLLTLLWSLFALTEVSAARKVER